MQIARSVVIDCHIEDVFAYVADASNDGAWRGAAARVEQVGTPPQRIAWREGEADLAFELEAVWTSTRVTRRVVADLGAALPLRRLRIGRKATRELRALRQVLERRG